MKGIIVYLISIALFVVMIYLLGIKGVIGFFAGSFLTAFFMMHYLYKKSDVVKAGIDMIGDRLK